MYGIPIPLMIRNDSLSFKYENFIRVYHVYIKVWSRILGECLLVKKEPSNGVEKNTVAVIPLHSGGREEVVGHKPQKISKVVRFHCISLSLSLSLSVSLCLSVSLFLSFSLPLSLSISISLSFSFSLKLEQWRSLGIFGQSLNSVY